jgi:GNAT superfamily N-acetyltransferase
MSGSSTTTIREMTAEDADQVAALSGELGYPSTPEQIVARLEGIGKHTKARAFVALDGNGRVQGWVHVYGRYHVESDRTAEIGGLVVAAEWRSRGIGRALMGAAEAWAREGGYGQVRLGSNVARDDAHRFYRNLGYTISKSHYRFQKPVR